MFVLKSLQTIFTLIIIFFSPAQAFSQGVLKLLKTKKIYDNNSYCAFTGLAMFQDKYYCTFREASRHHVNFDDPATWGKIVLLESGDLETWKKVGEYREDSIDMRDPKLKVTSDEKNLILLYHKHRIFKNKIGNPYSVVRMFKKGDDFIQSEEKIVIRGYERIPFVLWNTTNYKGKQYGFVCGKKFMLVRSDDGVNYDVVSDCTSWAEKNQGMNESNIAFLGRKAYAVIRSSNNQGFWGESKYPFKKWKWEMMNISVGGPNLYVLNKKAILIGSRDYSKDKDLGKTVVFKVDKGNWSQAEKLLVLDSSSDSSYPCCLKIDDNRLIVSYYSGNAAHANIYVASLQVLSE